MPRAIAVAIGIAVALAVVSGTAPAAGEQTASLVSGSQRVERLTVADPDAEARSAARPDVVGPRYPWIMPRSTTDRPDEATGPQVHVVYLVPVDMPDEQLDKLGVLHDSMSSVNSWLRQQTGDKQWRLDTFTFVWDDPRTDRRESKKVQAVDVTFLPYRLPSERVRDLSGVEGALKLAGLDEDGKRYIVYVASSAGGVCGSAYWTLEPTGEFDGKYSDIFLYSDSACRSMEFATGPRSPSYAETIVMQELMHNDGVVPMTAPHNCLVSQGAYGHVCTGPLWATDNDPEEFDVMYPYVSLPLSEKSLDADRLDYFRHPFPVRDFEDSPYLETVPQ